MILIEFGATAIIAYVATDGLGFAMTGAAHFLSVALIGSLRLAYYAGLEAFVGATLGKKLLRLQVRGPVGSAPPTLGAALRRNAWVTLGLVPGSFGWALWLGALLSIWVTIQADDGGRGWHDRIGGGTRVILAED